MQTLISLTGNPTTFDDHDPLAHSIHEVLQEFVDEVGERGCASHFDKVVSDKYRLKGRNLIQEPERFIEDHLVFPLLEGPLGHNIRPRPKQYAPRWPRQGGVPDFCLTTIPVGVAMDNGLRAFGEVKPPKNMERARKEMRNYLNDDLELDALTILTDGFDWELWVRPRGESITEEYEPRATATLRDPLQAIRARNMEVDTSRPFDIRDRIDADAFSAFTRNTVESIVEAELECNTSE